MDGKQISIILNAHATPPFVQAGMSITKHPRWGAPEKRILYLKAEEGKMYLVWSSTKEQSALWGVVGGILSMGAETREDMDSIVEIREGLTTKVRRMPGEQEFN